MSTRATLVEALRSEARVLRAAVRSITRKPLEPVDLKPGWRSFSAMETSSYRNVVQMLLVLIIFEAPTVHLLLAAVMEDGVARGVVRALLLGSSIYLATWLIGDLRLLRETPGVLLGTDMLVIEMGTRINGSVALQNVAAVERIVAEDRNSSPRTIRITPLPQPNCRIRLKSALVMRGMFGAPLSGDVLAIYVDDPATLVAAIETAVASAQRGS